jgi:hypothetical protein
MKGRAPLDAPQRSPCRSGPERPPLAAPNPGDAAALREARATTGKERTQQPASGDREWWVDRQPAVTPSRCFRRAAAVSPEGRDVRVPTRGDRRIAGREQWSATSAAYRWPSSISAVWFAEIAVDAPPTNTAVRSASEAGLPQPRGATQSDETIAARPYGGADLVASKLGRHPHAQAGGFVSRSRMMASARGPQPT